MNLLRMAAFSSMRAPGVGCCTAIALLCALGTAQAAAVDYQLKLVATVDATQDWLKNDPKNPGKQWSKGSTTQRYEITTRLRTDGAKQVRNLLDPDVEARMEAKTIHLARQAKKAIEASGGRLILPKTPADEAALAKRFQNEVLACKGDAECNATLNLEYAAIYAAVAYPEAMEPDEDEGRYLYLLPYKGCPGKSRVQLTMNIAGERYNKTVDRLVAFEEKRTADSIDASDGRSLCSHFTVVLDPDDAKRPLWIENVHVPSPVGVTEFIESKHTSRATEPQPMPTAALEWITETLRHAPASGKASATLPLPLSLNGNSTWLGLWTGSVKVTLDWSFLPVPSAPAAKPATR
ncbi:hypothetical protein [Nevskia sp.]|uniref:hypothetical protein n=1 Tax=Nevskia sp. TaxID=1929292 RepID=UPI0025D08B65|nr:hypothetical protein [Nevskia sp.]